MHGAGIGGRVTAMRGRARQEAYHEEQRRILDYVARIEALEARCDRLERMLEGHHPTSETPSNVEINIDELLATVVGWSVSAVSNSRYHGYDSPSLYFIEDTYYAIHKTKPKHMVGDRKWRKYEDQYVVESFGLTIWTCEL